jgi:hypothetical protein
VKTHTYICTWIVFFSTHTLSHTHIYYAHAQADPAAPSTLVTLPLSPSALTHIDLTHRGLQPRLFPALVTALTYLRPVSADLREGNGWSGVPFFRETIIFALVARTQYAAVRGGAARGGGGGGDGMGGGAVTLRRRRPLAVLDGIPVTRDEAANARRIMTGFAGDEGHWLSRVSVRTTALVAAGAGVGAMALSRVSDAAAGIGSGGGGTSSSSSSAASAATSSSPSSWGAVSSERDMVRRHIDAVASYASESMDAELLEREALPPVGTLIGKIEILIAFLQMYATLLELDPFPEAWMDFSRWCLTLNLTFDFAALRVPYRRYVVFGAVMLLPIVLVILYLGGGGHPSWWRRKCIDRWPRTVASVFLGCILCMVVTYVAATFADWNGAGQRLLDDGDWVPRGAVATILIVAGATVAACTLVWATLAVIFRSTYRHGLGGDSGAADSGGGTGDDGVGGDPHHHHQPVDPRALEAHREAAVEEATQLAFDRVDRLRKRAALFVVTVSYLPIVRAVLVNFQCGEAAPSAPGRCPEERCLANFPELTCVFGPLTWHPIHWISVVFGLAYVIGIPIVFYRLIRRGAMGVKTKVDVVHKELKRRRVELKELIQSSPLGKKDPRVKELKDRVAQIEEKFHNSYANARGPPGGPAPWVWAVFFFFFNFFFLNFFFFFFFLIFLIFFDFDTIFFVLYGQTQTCFARFSGAGATKRCFRCLKRPCFSL